MTILFTPLSAQDYRTEGASTRQQSPAATVNTATETPPALIARLSADGDTWVWVSYARLAMDASQYADGRILDKVGRVVYTIQPDDLDGSTETNPEFVGEFVVVTWADDYKSADEFAAQCIDFWLKNLLDVGVLKKLLVEAGSRGHGECTKVLQHLIAFATPRASSRKF